MNIYVLVNHWCLLAKETSRTAKAIHLSDAYVIRRWGTTRGIGQLAIHGLRAETILDPLAKRTIINPNEVTFEMVCEGDYWSPEYIAGWMADKRLDGEE